MNQRIRYENLSSTTFDNISIKIQDYSKVIFSDNEQKQLVTMYILGRSMSQGKKAGVLSASGISTGRIVHWVFTALCFSIILTKSAMAFEIVKYLGVAN